MIKIHWDFKDNTELSYREGLDKGDNFTTHCLDFFNMDSKVEVIVVDRDDNYISLKNINSHSDKEIRTEHNVRRMLVAGKFKWFSNYVGDTKEKLKILEKNFKKEFNKYYKTMNYRIMSIEVDALYNVLVLKKKSEYEETRRHEHNVSRILNL